MSEAYGSILVKAPPALLAPFLAEDGCVSWAAIDALLAHAGLTIEKCNPMLKFYVDQSFSHEGIERQGDFINVTIFGEEWMYAVGSLVAKGRDVEIYGVISHEHGFTQYYALNDKGERFCETIDFEGDDDVDEEATTGRWLAHVPAPVREAFPGVFEPAG